MGTRRIRSSIFLLGVAIAVLLAAALSGPSALGHGDALDNAFARRAAGSYLVDLPERSERYLLAVSADGRLLSEDTNDFGDGVPAAFQSAFHGAWKRTGRRELFYTVLSFGFDAGGVNTTIVRHSATVVFDERFQTFHQAGAAAVFTAAQDPLDPLEVPIATVEFSGSGRRIRPMMSP